MLPYSPSDIFLWLFDPRSRINQIKERQVKCAKVPSLKKMCAGVSWVATMWNCIVVLSCSIVERTVYCVYCVYNCITVGSSAK